MCAASGALELCTSPKLRGAGANWTYIGPMIVTNKTPLDDSVTAEFVTSGYFGSVLGDPRGGHAANAAECHTMSRWLLRDGRADVRCTVAPRVAPALHPCGVASGESLGVLEFLSVSALECRDLNAR
jgi:hypothetical protein